MGRLLKKAKFLFFDGCIYYLMAVYTICSMGRLLKKAKFLFFDGCIYYLMAVYTICSILMFMYIFFLYVADLGDYQLAVL